MYYTCYATEPPKAYSDSFSNFENLYVPEESIELYKEDNVWGLFQNISSIQDDIPSENKCETPVISYSNGSLSFSCETSGAVYHYTIKDNDCISDVISKDGNLKLNANIDISVYATADGHSQSETATATLYWLDASLSNNTINTTMRGLVVSIENGIIRITGLNNNENVSFYTMDNKLIGSTKAIKGIALYSISSSENHIIAKIGNNDINIIVR